MIPNKKVELAIIFSLAFALLSLGIFLTFEDSSNGITGAAIAGITNGSIGNQSYLNCTVAQGNCSNLGFTRILGLFNYTNSHVELHNQTGFNYSLCCASTAAGVVINTTNTSDSASFNFLDLFQNNNSHVEVPNASLFHYADGSNLTLINNDPYNVSAFISTSSGYISCNYYENLYGNCTYENETCLLTIPVNQTANTTNLHVSSCNDSQFDTSVCCSLTPILLTIYVDGNETDNFTNAGEPYNITVQSTASTTIKAEECNGLNHFSLIQSIDSNVTNCAYSVVTTDASGQVSYTNVPTGGDSAYTDPFNYTINFQAISGSSVLDEKSFTVVNRAPPAASSKSSSVVNQPNVEGTNERILIVFDRISRSRISGSVAGQTHSMLFYDNGTSQGTSATLVSGQPTGLNITVLNSTDLSPLSNLTVKLREESGLMHWGLIQYQSAGATTNVSNYVEGTTTTDSSGNALITVVPTSGFISTAVDSAIGPYSVNLSIVWPNGTELYNNNLSVDRTLPSPSPASSVPNSGEIEGFNEKVLVLFDRVKTYIS